jgi:hypothetical protein
VFDVPAPLGWFRVTGVGWEEQQRLACCSLPCDRTLRFRGAASTNALLRMPEAVGKRFGGVDIANGDDELAPAIALRRHAEG